MILLAVDTSGKNGSIALARVRDDGDSNGPDPVEVVQVVALEGGTFSAQLVPQIAAVLSKHGLGKNDIGGFAVVSGPGSFTGMRVGLAAIKALAEVLHKPIAAVSLLEAVARKHGFRGQVLAALDAGRREVYVGAYDVGEIVRMRSERLLSWEEFLAEATGIPVVTPDNRLADAARKTGLRVEEIRYPAGDIIARLGWEKIRSGETTLPEDLDANYIRRSDAEIFTKNGR